MIRVKYIGLYEKDSYFKEVIKMEDGFKKGFGFMLGAYAAGFVSFMAEKVIVTTVLKEKNTSEKGESKTEEES